VSLDGCEPQLITYYKEFVREKEFKQQVTPKKHPFSQRNMNPPRRANSRQDNNNFFLFQRQPQPFFPKSNRLGIFNQEQNCIMQKRTPNIPCFIDENVDAEVAV
jgi:hypothetical protein